VGAEIPGRRTNHGAWAAGLVVALAALHLAVLAQGDKPAEPSALQVTVERLGNFYYSGDPVMIRVAVFNTGKTPYDNSKGIDVMGGLIVGDRTSGVLKHKEGAGVAAVNQPSVLAPGEFFGFIFDLNQLVDGLEKPGTYAARFQSPGLETEAVSMVVIPRYDPAVAYRATIDTDYGTLQFDLFGKEAPAHVHNFFDLGNQGYYDGTLLYTVVKGIEVQGGDKTGNGESTPGYGLPPEIDPSLKHVRGSLSMLRGEKTDHGSLFMISLADSPAIDGQMTIFGAMAGGEEALSAIENLPTNGRKSLPFYRPLKDARIRSIHVAPAPSGSKATPEGAPVKATSKP